MGIRIAWIALLVALGCAAPPPTLHDAQRAAVWGYLELVPHEGVAPHDRHGGAYGSRLTERAKRVDYSTPGFAVVFVGGAELVPAPGDLALEIRPGLAGPRFEPAERALPQGSRVVVHNATDVERLVSCPRAGWVGVLEPGAQKAIEIVFAGEVGFFLPGQADTEARLFASPGPYARVAADGRYPLTELPPGHYDLQVWHPRLPPAHAALELRAGEVARRDLRIGVGATTASDEHGEHHEH